MSKAFDNIRSGQVITFPYHGGSKPGDLRFVEAQRVEDKGTDRLLHGYDVKIGEYRNYYESKADTVDIIANPGETIIFPEDIFSGLSSLSTIDGQRIVNAYKALFPEVKEAKWHAGTSTIVARQAVEPALRVTASNGKMAVEFVNQDGEVLAIEFDAPNSPHASTQWATKLKKDEANRFAAELFQHYYQDKSDDPKITKEALNDARSGYPPVKKPAVCVYENGKYVWKEQPQPVKS